MMTLDQAIAATKLGHCLDGRDAYRLARFVPTERLAEIGVEVKDGETHVPQEFTRENVLEQLRKDVAFGFDKALDQRGISAGLMYQVVQMWNTILQDGLEDFEDYAQYGLPLFKATAVKYGFNNPIGEDRGDEPRYACEG